MAKDNGGYVHPTNEHQYGTNNSDPGMTLRDHFAGLAMQGMWANSEFLTQLVKTGTALDMIIIGISKRSYEQADAMIAERKK